MGVRQLLALRLALCVVRRFAAGRNRVAVSIRRRPLCDVHVRVSAIDHALVGLGCAGDQLVSILSAAGSSLLIDDGFCNFATSLSPVRARTSLAL